MVSLALFILGFLAGSIPFGLLIARVKGIDIRAHGSGNIGATNVGRVLGPRLGKLCFALDFLKGLLPTLGAGLALGTLGTVPREAEANWIWLACMVAPILGHVFCPWLGFRGGKGVATGAGALLAVFPVMTIAGLGAALTFFAVFRLTRYVSAGSLAAGMSLIPGVGAAWAMLDAWSGTQGEGPRTSGMFPYLIVAMGLAVLVAWTHRANIGRLRRGEELRATPGGGTKG